MYYLFNLYYSLLYAGESPQLVNCFLGEACVTFTFEKYIVNQTLKKKSNTFFLRITSFCTSLWLSHK